MVKFLWILSVLFIVQAVAGEEKALTDLSQGEASLHRTWRAMVKNMDEGRAKEIQALLMVAHQWNLKVNELLQTRAKTASRRAISVEENLKQIKEAYDARCAKQFKKRRAAERSFEIRFAALREEQTKKEATDPSEDTLRSHRGQWDALVKEREREVRQMDAEKARLFEDYLASISHANELDAELHATIKEAQASQKRAREALQALLQNARELPKQQLSRHFKEQFGLEMKEQPEKELWDWGVRFLPWSYLFGPYGLRFSLEVGGDFLGRDSSEQAAPDWFRRVLEGYFVEGLSIRMEGERPVALYRGRPIRLSFWRIDENGRRSFLSAIAEHYLGQKWIETVLQSFEEPRRADLSHQAGVRTHFAIYRLDPLRGAIVLQAEEHRIVANYVEAIIRGDRAQVMKYRTDEASALGRDGLRLIDARGTYRVVWFYSTKEGPAPWEVDNDQDAQRKEGARRQLENWGYELSIFFSDRIPIPPEVRQWLWLAPGERLRPVMVAKAPRVETSRPQPAPLPVLPAPRSETPKRAPPLEVAKPAPAAPPARKPQEVAEATRFPRAATTPFECRKYQLRWESDGELSVTEEGAKEPLFTVYGIRKSGREIACVGTYIAFIGNGLKKGKDFEVAMNATYPKELQEPDLAQADGKVVAIDYTRRPLFIIDANRKTLKRALLVREGPMTQVLTYTESGESRPTAFAVSGKTDGGKTQDGYIGFELIIGQDGSRFSISHSIKYDE